MLTVEEKEPAVILCIMSGIPEGPQGSTSLDS